MKIKLFLKVILEKLILAVLDSPLPSSSEKDNKLAKELIQQLSFVMNECPSFVSLAMEDWNYNVASLLDLVKKDDIRSFLRWDVIKRTMFVGNAFYVLRELKSLRQSHDWKSRWSHAIIENKVGHPIPFALFPKSSGNLIHHAYHINQFEKSTGITVEKLNFVFEFGGGYGSMCRLFHNLGFRGKYVIFDLAPFSVLQEYYLKAIGLPVYTVSSFKDNEWWVVCVSDVEDLKKVIFQSKAHTKDKNLFLATWSLSESPKELRESICELVAEFGNLLLAYQDRFDKTDNTIYFEEFRKKFKDIVWHNWEIEHLPSNYYLMGSKEI